MARDNHPRIRQAKALARKKGQRPPYDRVLIVCEGTKTEPLYFEAIRKKWRIPSSHITVLQGDGTQPKQIVDFAENIFLKTKAYEWVFTVFDRDSHTTYHEALQKASGLDKKLKNDERKPIRFIAIPSVPCFELWLLLHYQDVHAFGHRAEILQKLKTHLTNYEKGVDNAYEQTESLLNNAIKRAEALQSINNPMTGTTPFTGVHQIVKLLHSLKCKN